MPWTATQVAFACGFKARSDLQHAKVVLEEWIPTQQRWRVRVEATGEVIAVKEAMLFDAALESGAAEPMAESHACAAVVGAPG